MESILKVRISDLEFYHQDCLHSAVTFIPELVEYFIKRGANINEKSRNHFPLVTAVQDDNLLTTTYLLDLGCKIPVIFYFTESNLISITSQSKLCCLQLKMKRIELKFFIYYLIVVWTSTLPMEMKLRFFVWEIVRTINFWMNSFPW